MERQPGQRGFTLVELLVVIGIVGLLITLLVPTIAWSMRKARTSMTESALTHIAMALDAFKADFKTYPPSRPHDDPTSASQPGGGRPKGDRPTGAANLAYYLRGPVGSGWGIDGGGLLPFGEGLPRRSYGPYYVADDKAVRYSDLSSERGQVAGFLDAFRPPGVILYFLASVEPAPSRTAPETMFFWTDNNRDGTTSADATAKTNYASSEYLEDCLKVESSSGVANPDRPYRRQDYFLVSPGQDGRYGAMDWDAQGNVVPKIHRQGGEDDDVLNWSDTKTN